MLNKEFVGNLQNEEKFFEKFVESIIQKGDNPESKSTDELKSDYMVCSAMASVFQKSIDDQTRNLKRILKSLNAIKHEIELREESAHEDK